MLPAPGSLQLASPRFAVGATVMCKCSSGWRLGRVVALHYRKEDWPPERVAPYQVRLEDDHSLIYVPQDVPSVCREASEDEQGRCSDSDDICRSCARGTLKSGVVVVHGGHHAFAAIKDAGAVISWSHGKELEGYTSEVAARLASGVQSVTPLAQGTHLDAFAALKDDGSVVTWGNPSRGGDSSQVAAQLASGVRSVTSSDSAFAALKDNGCVVTWGHRSSGGDSSDVASQLASGVKSITSAPRAFAAFKDDGSMIHWGYLVCCRLHCLPSGVRSVTATQFACAALKGDGSVVTWGNPARGGDSSRVATQLASGVCSVTSSDSAFAALKDTGSIVTWGQCSSGGDSSDVASQLTRGVKSVISTSSGAFAALKENGATVIWGHSYHGGDCSRRVASQIADGVQCIASTAFAFAALKRDASIVTWGGASGGGDSSKVTEELAGGVQSVAANESSFAALKGNGSVVTWGCPSQGGDSSKVAAQLASGVQSVSSSAHAFAALKDDGSVVTWGSNCYVTWCECSQHTMANFAIPAPSAPLASETGDAVPFMFISRQTLLDLDGASQGLPRWEQIPKRKIMISLAAARRGEYARKFLVLSHRWQREDCPDPNGRQLRALLQHVRDGDPEIEWIWVDYSCLPQCLKKTNEIVRKLSPEADAIFSSNLKQVNVLFWSMKVLILHDRQYLSRFWCLLECFLAHNDMLLDGNRGTIKWIGTLEESGPAFITELQNFVQRDFDAIMELLDGDDINVTNGADKPQQIARVRERRQQLLTA